MGKIVIKEIKGNLLDTHCKLIAHGVNCQGQMQSGVAKALYEKWPKVKEEYLKMSKVWDCPDSLLGSVNFVDIQRRYDKIIVANCFTQQNYGYDGQIYLNYQALEFCFSDINLHCLTEGILEIAMPKIGCGLAGGNWEKVKEIIKEEFHHDITINVYFLE